MVVSKIVRVLGAGVALTLGAVALPTVAGAEFDAGVLIDDYYVGDPWVGVHERVIGDHYRIMSADGVTAESIGIHGAHAENGPFPVAHHD